MATPKKIVLVAFGSLGDLHPIMALAQALKACGAQPILCSHPYLRQKVETAGLTFHPFGPDQARIERDLGMSPADMLRLMTRNQNVLFGRIVAPYLAESVRDLAAVVADCDMVVGTSLAFAGHIAARLAGKPFVTAALSPAVLISAYDPLKTPEAPFFLAPNHSLGRVWNRLLFSLGQLKMRPGLAPIHKTYRRYGLPIPKGLAGVTSDLATLALFSPLLAAQQPDHPPHTVFTGFPFFDSEDGRLPRLPPKLDTFLKAGRPPLVFSLGSAAIYLGESFYRTAIRVSQGLGERCVLLVGSESRLLKENFGPDVCVVAYAPHSLLLPQARAVIHHGGIGSVGQALRSGRPQLITPVFADQFDNAHRVQKLGAGLALDFKAFNDARAKKQLQALLSDQAIAKRVVELAAAVTAEDGAATAAGIILSL